MSAEPVHIDIEDDQDRLYADEVLWCECDTPSPVIDPTRLDGHECASCRKGLAR